MSSAFRGPAFVLVATFVFAGCGGSTGTNGTLPMGATMQSGAHHASSSSGDLLYVADGRSDVFVLSYPEAKLVGDLSVSEAWGLCSDTNGNVFVTEDSGNVLEYAHGGTTPINTLSAHGAFSCSWDPSTGNLAVVERPNSIAIFSGGSGSAQTYTDASFREFNYCAYDDKGNLFADGQVNGPYPYGLAEFNTRSGSFKTIALNEKVDILEDLQWDGKYLAIDDFFGSTGDHKINRVHVSGSSGTIETTTNLGGAQFYGYWTWLQDGTFISPIFTGGHDDKRIDFWSYPSGGKPTKKLPRSDFKSKGPIRGITVSVAPSGGVDRSL